jgi:hypothetical protein
LVIHVQRKLTTRLKAKRLSVSTLDPALYLSPASALAWVEAPRLDLGGEAIEIIEGKRDTARSGSDGDGMPIYRQANLSALRWKLSAEDWKQPTITDRTCVLPGDIVVNKLAPIRAAIATSRLYRHAVDANCYLIRGMERVIAFWTAFCLNQPLYEEYLLRSAGASILPRVTMRALRELPLLSPPAECRNLAERTWGLIDSFLSHEENIRRVIAEAQDRICPPETLRFWQARIASLETPSWWRRVPGTVIPDSLLPGHSLFEILRQELQANLGWVPLDRCMAPATEQPARTRLPMAESSPEQVRLRCLRISDVCSDLTVAQAPEKADVAWPGRVYRLPLKPEEVLVSLLVSSSTVAYAGDIPRSDIYVTDHWERLRFRETPGAWAMILSSPLIGVQLRLLAQGSARQFLSSGAVRQVLVPVLPREERLPWDRALLRYQQHRLELEESWGKLWHEALAAYDRTHREAGIAVSFSAEGLDGGVGV